MNNDEYKKTIDDANEFYAGVVMAGGYVIDTDVGFVKAGRPIFANMDAAEVLTLQMAHMTHRNALYEAGHDAQEVMQFFEHVAIVQLVTEQAYFPEALSISPPKDLASETQEEKDIRRSSHLYHCVKNAAMAAQPDVVYLSDDGSGFAIDASNSHPLLRMYVDSMEMRLYDGAVKQDETMMLKEDVQGFLNEKTRELNPLPDIDPDSDENDDDPFRGYA